MLTLIDLNVKFLEAVWRHLNLEDIINIAEAYGITVEKIEQLEADNTNPSAEKFIKFATTLQMAAIKKGASSQPSLLMNTRLLQHFGYDAISKISIDYKMHDTHLIGPSILTQHHESLVSIELMNIDETTLADIVQPFPNVEHLTLIKGRLGERFSNFANWFPQLHTLHLAYLFIEKPENIESHFPNLLHFSLRNDASDSAKYKSLISDTNVKIFIQLNPQLTSLSLSDDAAGHDDYGIRINQQFVYFLNRKLPHLTSLSLDILHLRQQTFRHDELVIFNSLQCLRICVRNWSDLSIFPIVSQQLHELEIRLHEDWNTSVNFIAMESFLSGNESIQKLTIESCHNVYDLYDKHMSKLMNRLPALEELSINYDWTSPMAIDAIVYLLKNCQKISTLTAHGTIHCRLDAETFTSSFEESALINGLDAGAWDLEFDEQVESSGTELSVTFNFLGSL